MDNSKVLVDFTDEDLAEELERRGQIATIIPRLLSEPLPKYMAQLREMAETHVQACVDPDIRDKDTAHYMYEAAMQMLYGPDIFVFLNEYAR